MKLRLTSIGRLFLTVVGLLYLASITSQSGLLLTLIGVLGGCFLVNWIVSRRTVGKVQLDAPLTQFLYEGEKISQPWKLRNTSRRELGAVEFSSPLGVLFRVRMFRAEEVQNRVPELVFTRRGVYRHGEIQVASLAPFGLLHSLNKLNIPGEVVVYPALYPVDPPRAAGYDAMVGGKHQGGQRTTSGAQFAGIRPWQAGDPLKQIHWKSSSKGLGLMVKTFDEELSGRVAIVVDGGHAGPGKEWDNCLRAAGSLMFSALDEGHHVEWADVASLEVKLVPPFDEGHDILETLARLEASPGCLTSEHIERALERVSPRSALAFVMATVNDAVLEATHRLTEHHRLVALYVPEGVALPKLRDGLKVYRFGEKHICEESP